MLYINQTEMIIQMTGLSGAGKTSIVQATKIIWPYPGISFEIVDGDVYRNTLCSDLGFSKKDRCENIRRLGKVAHELAGTKNISVIAAINPYQIARQELKNKYKARTVWIDCPLQELLIRDTKGLYRRAFMQDGAPDKIYNLTGVNDPYEAPFDADLIIRTERETLEESAQKLLLFMQKIINQDY
ncbi:adenylyl-sulfate kinase [Flavitalea flava]